MLSKIQKYWYPAYIIGLVLLTLLVFSVLKRKDVQLDTGKKTTKEAVEIKLIDVALIVEINNSNKEYSAKLKNIDTVYDLLDEIRQTDGLYYEITDYLYGTEIDGINRVFATEGNKWVVLKSDKGNDKPEIDVTKNLKDIRLNKDCTIKIKQVATATQI